MARDACDILDGRGLGESRGEFDGPIMEGGKIQKVVANDKKIERVMALGFAARAAAVSRLCR
jgi:hypothetical protein